MSLNKISIELLFQKHTIIKELMQRNNIDTIIAHNAKFKVDDIAEKIYKFMIVII